MWIWPLGAWLDGEHGAGSIIALEDHKGLAQPKLFCDSNFLLCYCFSLLVPELQSPKDPEVCRAE